MYTGVAMVRRSREKGSDRLDPITVEVVGSSLLAAADEMGENLVRSSFSTNVKERRDCSTAILDSSGGTIAQAAHQPVHLGSMLGLVQAILSKFPENKLNSGDIFVANDPYSGGGTHLPDITLAAPVFAQGKLIAFVASCAHHAETGGSPSQALDIYSEGIRIPLVRLVEAGSLCQDILDIILLNCRLPKERQADIQAQAGCLETGIKRVQELVDRYGYETILECLERHEEQAAKQARAGIASIPLGTYTFTDYMEGTTPEELIPIKLALTVGDGEITCDFTGTAAQVNLPINLPYYATLASIYYTIKAVLDPTLPANVGFFKTIKVIAPEGSFVNCVAPAPCIFRSDACQRVVDVVIGALSKAIPDRVIAAANGCVSGVYFLGYQPDGSYFAYIETLGGGMGAGIPNDGADGIHVHGSNTSNLPIEALELDYPMMIDCYQFAPDSGGPGRQRGGLGFVRQYRMLTDGTRVRTKGDRSFIAPWGLQGGLSGGKAQVTRNYGTELQQSLTTKEYNLVLDTQETIRLVTPGAGGFGNPNERSRDKVLSDLQQGKISLETAEDIYGISDINPSP